MIILLVPHTSHLLQPLDVGIFCYCKNEMRRSFEFITSELRREEIEKDIMVDANHIGAIESEFSILTNNDTEIEHFVIPQSNEQTQTQQLIEEIDGQNNELEEEIVEATPQQRGERLVTCICDVLKAYHSATSRPTVVSAFRQCGLEFKVSSHNINKKEVLVNPKGLRVVNKYFPTIFASSNTGLTQPPPPPRQNQTVRIDSISSMRASMVPPTRRIRTTTMEDTSSSK
ncbi:hypothetical protein EIN_162430 [Entamoeba invadens IP1]|uniref:Uncharacterized protein n=1 Tax=Entamoeba invadens IP1 TaxID=370355 RepID=A0A0A1TYN6_ENTIV|nr:hypothetical protein EIN_162430 [Entamoeba invadens IP1]ELP86599.1 hypothetical protein EIN_162430 [Entamoeba invadens IP1]|eukprot:XP_004185945.1 hypothetical protein EIN_162430 [Entamoeba invadens IP1]